MTIIGYSRIVGGGVVARGVDGGEVELGADYAPAVGRIPLTVRNFEDADGDERGEATVLLDLAEARALRDALTDELARRGVL